MTYSHHPKIIAETRAIMPKNIKDAQAEFTAAQRAAYARFDAIPGGRTSAARAEKERARAQLRADLDVAESAYSSAHDLWYNSHHS